ncbi:MAG: alpha-xylosidase [Eubacteriales bacterium]|nr:alpha-xylosidase [Eubacteriales bacterium]
MKFTNGYWLLKPEYDMTFAVEAYKWQTTENSLKALCPGTSIRERGDTLNGGTLTVTLTAPVENVLRVNVCHFRGARPTGPRFATADEHVTPTFGEDENTVSIQSGELKATLSKAARSWSVVYSAKGKRLTESGFRGMARALHKPTGQSYMIDSLYLDVGEKVYGFGERFTPYVKNGQVVETWNEDGGTASEIAYKSVPFYMTNRGYGVFVEDPGDVSFEVASEKVERVQFSLPGEELTYDIIYGETPKEILMRYTALTGRPALPPAWSFGLWLTTSFTTSYDEQTVTKLIDGMAKYDIPLNVFHFDSFWMKGFNWCDFRWDPDTFPDPAGMLGRLKARELHICVWMNPYIAQESPLFAEGMENGYLIRKENGDVWQTDLWQAGMGIVDVTNPAARAWFCGYLKRLLDMGVDCFKTDFGERIPVRGIRYHDGSNPVKMHNYYSFLYNQMVFELLERERGQGEAMLFARSATAGGQQFPVHWGGDNSASYISMAETLRAGLSISHSGFGFWSHDISGFEKTAPADVYKRWCAFGMLSSHSRLHGSASYRVPWLFGEESCVVLKEFVNLKCRLMPYLFRVAVEAHQTGVPMLRPMMLEFPGDIAAEACDTQYMLGDQLLVAPVFHEDGHVDYYLPEGHWTHLLSGQVTEGSRWLRETHDFHSLPLMVRENTVLPMGVCDTRADYDYADGVTLHVFEPADGTLTLTIPDTAGNVDARYTLTVHGDEITVDKDTAKPCHVVLHRGGKTVPLS